MVRPRFSEAISLVVNCRDQQEVDYYRERLLADGGAPAAQRAMGATMQMIQLDVGEARRAFERH